MHPFERAMLRQYLITFATRRANGWTLSWRTSSLRAFILRHARELGVACAMTEDDDNLSITVTSTFRPVAPLPAPSRLERRLRWLCHLLQLAPLERRLLGLLVRAKLSAPVSRLLAALDTAYGREPQDDRPGMVCDLRLCQLLGIDTRDLKSIGSRALSLVSLGFVEERLDTHAASPLLLKLIGLRTLDEAAAWSLLCGKPRRTDLAWADFAHLGEDGEMACRLVAGGLKARARGLNILLHGAPGVGKTQFACALAERLGLNAMFVGEADEDGEEPDRRSRLGALAVSQKLAANAKSLLLVVDEADDLFVGVDDARGANRKGAKVFVNALVEASPIPTLWISNHPDRLGQAVLRRMAFAVSFPEQDRAGRTRMVHTIAARHKVALPETEVARLAALKAPAAIIDHGIRATHLCGGEPGIAAKVSASILSAMEGRSMTTKAASSTGFVAALSNADHDLPDMIERIVASGRRDISLCLHGLPGSGKSAFARYLAARMGVDVIERRASDLFGMFVGETEEKIADAFREAKREKAFLIFDEADSLLRDRAGAMQSYEVTQVNEMLTAMERHPYPFACTTNRLDSLDPAAARRFVLKIGFLPLTQEQARTLFQRTFGTMAPAILDHLAPLTPGDFAVVARKSAVLGEWDPHRLLEALAAEVEAKPEGRSRPIGFMSRPAG